MCVFVDSDDEMRDIIMNESGRDTRVHLQIGVLLGGEDNDTKRQMQDIIDFETKLAEITTPPEERRDEEKLYNLMTLSELQRTAPFVRLTSLTCSSVSC